jgi:hypothetical protein
VLGVQFGISLEPLIGGAVLVFLKIRDEIIEEVGKVVLETVIADAVQTRRPGPL